MNFLNDSDFLNAAALLIGEELDRATGKYSSVRNISTVAQFLFPY